MAKDFSIRIYKTLLKRKIIFLNFASHSKMIKAILRPQEFFENKRWINNVFTWGEYKRWSKKERNEDPGESWAGCAIPRYAFYPFSVGAWKPSKEEKAVWDLIKDEYNLFDNVMPGVGYKPFFVIGLYRGGNQHFRHEMAHALYALDYLYQQIVDSIIEEASLDLQEIIASFLARHDYAVFRRMDETHAYLMDGIKYWEWVDKKIRTKKLRNEFKRLSKKLRKNFNTFRKLNKLPETF